MIPWLNDWYWPLDGWIIVAGILCAVSASLLGNFLVLRRMSLLGDAISHAVLPGLAVAFLVTGSRSSLPMFIGAVVVGILTALFTQWIRNSGNVDEGASMGVVFTTLFAIGLILIVRSADRVDLDPGCVLYGAIEFTPLDQVPLGPYLIPRVVLVQGIVLIVNLIFVTLFFKELRISSFDPALSTAMGIRASVMHYLLMTLVAVTSVASFESVGNILVVAMFVVPPAAALMLTNRLSSMVAWSAIIAALSAVFGHLSAMIVPQWFGFRSTSTAGMMAVAAGGLFLLAAIFGPKHGILLNWLRRQRTSLGILAEDIIALLYRNEERGSTDDSLSIAEIRDTTVAGNWLTQIAIWRERQKGSVIVSAGRVSLTDAGREDARRLVRSHRLWETYLSQKLDLPADRIHDKAERLEHFTDRNLRDRLGDATDCTNLDPHGSAIPPEEVN